MPTKKSMVLIESKTASDDATISLGGANWIDSYDVYIVQFSNVHCVTDAQEINFRFLDTSNNPITTSTYDSSFTELKSDAAFGDGYGDNVATAFLTSGGLGNDTNEQLNGTVHIFQSNNTAEYTFYTTETSYLNNSGVLRGNRGGGVITTAAATKGIQIYAASGKLTSGNFELYGLKK